MSRSVIRWPSAPALRMNPLTVDELAACAGVSKATLYSGSLNDVQADRLAVALGVHPFDLWPEWFDIEVADPSRCCCGSERVWVGRWVCRPCDRRKSARYRERVKVAS